MPRMPRRKKKLSSAQLRAKRIRAARRKMAARKRPKKNQILGLPSWVVIGGAALGLFLLARKAQAKTVSATMPGTNYLVQPTTGWGYPPMSSADFAKWCGLVNGLQSGTSCMVSGKGVFNLVGGRLKTGDQWVMDDDI